MTDSPDVARQIEALEAELRQRQLELVLLRETALAVGSELDLDTVFSLIANHARRLIQAQTVLVPILNADCDQSTYRAGAGDNIEEIIGESMDRDFGICGWVWRHQKPWWRGILAELSHEERDLWEAQAGTLIMVPLIGRTHFLGGIAGHNKLGGGEFTTNDLHLLELFAGQAAIAIENAMAMDFVEHACKLAEEAQAELTRSNRRLSAANQALEQLTLYDPLTGLPNRSLLCDRLGHEIDQAAAMGSQLVLLLIDIDRFQDLNESLGHEAGDALLKMAAERLSRLAAKRGGSIARTSGDEFAVLLGVDTVAAIGIAGEMREQLNQPMRLAGRDMVVTAAVGIAAYPRHGRDVSSLLKAADAAMIAAKRNRSGIEAFDATRDTGTTTRFALAHELRCALDHREFSLHYQPKLELASGRIHGVEAVSRH